MLKRHLVRAFCLFAIASVAVACNKKEVQENQADYEAEVVTAEEVVEEELPEFKFETLTASIKHDHRVPEIGRYELTYRIQWPVEGNPMIVEEIKEWIGSQLLTLQPATIPFETYKPSMTVEELVKKRLHRFVAVEAQEESGAFHIEIDVTADVKDNSVDLKFSSETYFYMAPHTQMCNAETSISLVPQARDIMASMGTMDRDEVIRFVYQLFFSKHMFEDSYSYSHSMKKKFNELGITSRADYPENAALAEKNNYYNTMYSDSYNKALKELSEVEAKHPGEIIGFDWNILYDGQEIYNFGIDIKDIILSEKEAIVIYAKEGSEDENSLRIIRENGRLVLDNKGKLKEQAISIVKGNK